MICKTIAFKSEKDGTELLSLLAGRSGEDRGVESKVRDIISEVRARGDEALLRYTREYDCPTLDLPLAVPEELIAGAASLINREDREAISGAAASIRAFHEAQVEKSWFITREDGSVVGQKVVPVDRAGLYVPGGKGGETPLVSSLLMNAIPALVAGVKEIAVVTPPRKDGSVNPYILFAANLLGIKEIYRVGGAWSIAGLAFGSGSIAAVDVIAGPGNIYVTTAKRLVQGRVAIDMIAGPSEILIVADASANPAHVAADMLSQAEHDTLASAICITDSPELAGAVVLELETLCASLPRAEIARTSLRDWGAVVITPGMDEAVRLANRLAPEHLELMVADPWALLPGIRHAGAVFMGWNSPEAVGDYFAGPNHVLPTMGTARFSSALSVHTFCKKTSIVAATREFINRHGNAIARLARIEGLEAHARSVESRYFANAGNKMP